MSIQSNSNFERGWSSKWVLESPYHTSIAASPQGMMAMPPDLWSKLAWRNNFRVYNVYAL